DEFVKIELLSPLGQKVKDVYTDWVRKGALIEQEILTSELNAGVYHVRIRGSRINQTYPLVVIR
ncbi:MAG: hypothetical protein AAFY71_20210, partial [Bacteroidota bacterium]